MADNSWTSPSYLVKRAIAARQAKQNATSQYVSPDEIPKMLADAAVSGHSCLQQAASGEVRHVSWSEMHDPSHFGPTVQVTLNMLNHADALGFDLSGEQYADIYRSMHPVAPVELVSDGEQTAIRERDKLLEVYKALCERHAALQADFLVARDRLAFLEGFYREAGDLVRSHASSAGDFTRVSGGDPIRMGWVGK